MLVSSISLLSLIPAVLLAIRTDFSLPLTLLAGIAAWLGCFLVLVLAAVGFLGFCCALVDQDKPCQEDSPFYRRLTAVYIRALIDLLRVRFDTQGLEKIPTEGRFLLVCNHQHEADPAVLLHFFRRSQLAFISKEENRDYPFAGKIMHKLQCQLINRENDRQALRGILNCIDIIRRDSASIAVFPEGGIKVLEKLSPFRPGVFKIATKTQVPIVVCTLQNTHNILPNALRLKSTRVRLHLVDVIQPEGYAGMRTTDLSAMVYNMMLEDLGPEYRLENEEIQ